MTLDQAFAFTDCLSFPVFGEGWSTETAGLSFLSTVDLRALYFELVRAESVCY